MGTKYSEAVQRHCRNWHLDCPSKDSVAELLESVLKDYDAWLQSPKLTLQSNQLETGDASGVVRPLRDDDGKGVENKPVETLSEWLDSYSGEWEATYLPGCGKRWLTCAKPVVDAIEDLVYRSARNTAEETDEEIEERLEIEEQVLQFIAEFRPPA